MKKTFRYISMVVDMGTLIVVPIQNKSYFENFNINKMTLIIGIIVFIICSGYLIYYYVSEYIKKTSEQINRIKQELNDRIFVLNQIIRAKNKNIFNRIRGVSGQNYFENIDAEKTYVISELQKGLFKDNKTQSELETIVNEYYESN